MYRPGIGEVELPNEIERALEEQRLVFFCGAGISVYTGLPLFKGLVEEFSKGPMVRFRNSPEAIWSLRKLPSTQASTIAP